MFKSHHQLQTVKTVFRLDCFSISGQNDFTKGRKIVTLTKKSKLLFLLLSAVDIILGVCIVVWPGFFALSLCYIFGALTLIFGIANIVCYIRRDIFGIPLFSELTFGILETIIGLLLIIHPAGILTFLPAFIGILIIIDSLIKVEASVDLCRAGIRGWWLILTLSVICALFGIILVIDPFEGADLLMIMIGISLIADGAENICAALYVSKYIKSNYTKETIYIDKH